MATIQPFAALRPRPELAARICELPYDVLSSEEARAQCAGNPHSFFRVSKPEVELPAGTDHYSAMVYEQGRRVFAKFVAEGWLRQDAEPRFHLYRQTMGAHAQTGLVAVASCVEYLRGSIKKHELTRPDKEDDRVRHIEALNAQTGPAFLTYRAVPEIDALMARHTAAAPTVNFTAPDGIRHSAWTLTCAQDAQLIQQAFAQLPSLYIADGHHRSAAAARVFQKRQGAGHSAWFLAVIFPHNQLQILPYNRVLKDLHGHTAELVMKKLQTVFTIAEQGTPHPTKKHQLGFYLAGQWRTLEFRREFTSRGSALEQLDVALLQTHVLHPVFGIENPRTSQRISFVGGIRGTGELEKLVNSGECACAFAMVPTSVEDLMAIADLGGIMPPKSTWFEPKLRDAMFCHGL